MKAVDSADEDGFEEAGIEIKSFDRGLHFHNHEMLPEANPIYAGDQGILGDQAFLTNTMSKSTK
jgi:hypothetical protein